MATTIRIVPPLKKVRLVDALDAIKRVADRPITYTVEGYAVVFSVDAAAINFGFGGETAQRPPPPPVVQIQTRSFKLDTNTFFASVKKMFRSQMDPVSDRVGEELRKDVFPKFGVKWNATENIILYNPLTGVLLVRASQEDLDIILAAIETLGGTAQSARGGGGGGMGGGGVSKGAGGGVGGQGGGGANSTTRGDSASPSADRNPDGAATTPSRQ
jgi:uncharacterized membrane protein YgcG